MFEKVMEKVALIDVMKDVAEAVERIKKSYEESIESAEARLSEATEKDWWIDSYKKEIEENKRRLSAVEKISEALVKLI